MYNENAENTVKQIISVIEDASKNGKAIDVMWDIESALFAGTRQGAIAIELSPKSVMLHRRIKEYCESKNQSQKIKCQMGICSNAQILNKEKESPSIPILLKENGGLDIVKLKSSTEGEVILNPSISYYFSEKYISYNKCLEKFISGINSDENLSPEDKTALTDALSDPNFNSDTILKRKCLPKKNALLLYAMYNTYVAKEKNINILLY